MSKAKNILTGLDDRIVIRDTVLDDDNVVHLYIDMPESQRICPDCGSEICWICDSGRDVEVHHLPMARKPCVIHAHLHHYQCQECHSTFYEEPAWKCKGTKMTCELRDQLVTDLTHYTNKKEVGRVNGVSPYFVNKALGSVKAEPPQYLPEIVCLDETKADVREYDPKTGKYTLIKYVTIFSDGATGQVLDLLSFKSKKQLIRYFKRHFSEEQRSKVKYVCSDMGKQYLFLAKDCFPNATVCLDNFHVVKNLNDASINVRTRLQDALLADGDEKGYGELKNLQKRLLTAARNHTDYWGDNYDSITSRLQLCLEKFPDLKDAYAMLQYFHDIAHDIPDYDLRVEALELWIKIFQDSLVDEIRHAVKMVRDHLTYIKNAWKYGLSNATSEGNNNSLKTIKKLSFGTRRFDYLRKRVLLVCSRPGTDRSRPRKAGSRKISINSFFYDDFPELKEYQLTTDLTYVNRLKNTKTKEALS